MFSELNAFIVLGLGGALLGAATYVYGCVIKSKAFRPLQVMGLCFALISTLQLTLAVAQGDGGRVNLLCGLVFGVLSLAVQAIAPLRGRRTDRRERASEPA